MTSPAQDFHQALLTTLSAAGVVYYHTEELCFEHSNPDCGVHACRNDTEVYEEVSELNVHRIAALGAEAWLRAVDPDMGEPHLRDVHQVSQLLVGRTTEELHAPWPAISDSDMSAWCAQGVARTLERPSDERLLLALGHVLSSWRGDDLVSVCDPDVVDARAFMVADETNAPPRARVLRRHSEDDSMALAARVVAASTQ